MGALSLGVRRGREILIGDRKLVVEEVLGANRVRVVFDGRRILVTDHQKEELMPGVTVQAGMPNSGRKSPETRLAFEAPRSVKIVRVADT
jgi:hypothetical protein